MISAMPIIVDAVVNAVHAAHAAAVSRADMIDSRKRSQAARLFPRSEQTRHRSNDPRRFAPCSQPSVIDAVQIILASRVSLYAPCVRIPAL